MELRFLSADGWRPEGVESDTVSLLLNGEVMVDTGWHAVHNLLREKIPIENVRTLLLTHLHQDHRMGLPALDYAGKFQDYPRAPGPVVRVLKAGDNLQAAGLTIRTAASHHSVPGLMYRFEDEAGHVLVYSGDTAPSQETVLFAEGADVVGGKLQCGNVVAFPRKIQTVLPGAGAYIQDLCAGRKMPFDRPGIG